MVNSLDSFSDELLDQIVRFLASPIELAVIVRVSKRFHGIALPYLYANVSFVDGLIDTGTKHLRPLTFLLLQRPDLAALVKSFSHRSLLATSHMVGPTEGEPKKWPQDPDLHKILKSVVEKHAKSEDRAKKWLEVIQVGNNEAAIIALLLPTLTNLRSLDVPFDYETDGNGKGADSDYIMTMLDPTMREELVFSNLTDVIIPGTNENYPNYPDWFAACVRLPVLKRIYGYNQGDEDRGSEDDGHVTRFFSKLQPRSSTLEFIELRRSKLNIKNFQFLLETPKALKTLIYEIGNAWAWTDVKFSAIESALNFQKESLQRLSLGYDPDFYPFRSEEGEFLTPMSFSTLTSLEQLRVFPLYLYGQDLLQLLDDYGTRKGEPPSKEELENSKMMLVDALPSQLVTLGLIQCNDSSMVDRLIISLREVLTYKERFENLREISIHSMKLDILEARLPLLKTLPWKDRGVRLVLKHEEELNHTEMNYTNRPWGWDGDVEWDECLNDSQGPVKVFYDSEA